MDKKPGRETQKVSPHFCFPFFGPPFPALGTRAHSQAHEWGRVGNGGARPSNDYKKRRPKEGERRKGKCFHFTLHLTGPPPPSSSEETRMVWDSTHFYAFDLLKETYYYYLQLICLLITLFLFFSSTLLNPLSLKDSSFSIRDAPSSFLPWVEEREEGGEKEGVCLGEKKAKGGESASSRLGQFVARR